MGRPPPFQYGVSYLTESFFRSLLEAMEPRVVEPVGPTIPLWQEGTTVEQAQEMLEDCVEGRVSNLFGMMGPMMAAAIIGEFGIDELYSSLEMGGVSEEEDLAVMWLAGSILGCWVGEPRFDLETILGS